LLISGDCRLEERVLDIGLEPRKYQLDAYRWALSKQRAVVVLPTGTGKTLIAVLWMRRLLLSGQAKKILVLEPTRFLVEQISRYIRQVGRLSAEPIHGSYPRKQREEVWKRAQVIVATPEVVVADRDIVQSIRIDAVVVDECHHTTGKDAYVEVMKLLDYVPYRLGLSAFIPAHRIKEIERLIGTIRSWSWKDPDVAPYIPPCIGEVYEAELNDAEKKLLQALEELRDSYVGRLRGLIQNAIRWFVRDGALALRDSMTRETVLAKLLEPIRDLVFNDSVRPSHKLDPFKRALRDHEGFAKSIVFIDRIAVATYVYDTLKSMGMKSVLIRGRMRRETLLKVLEEARHETTRVIVSTSAGEEGIDLPDADLLTLWSISSSPLRLVQRHGRVLRATPTAVERLRFVVYIVTVDTVDVDSLIDAVEESRRFGIDLPLDTTAIESLWRRSARHRIVRVLEGHPMTLEWLHEVTGIPIDILRRDVRRLCQRGEVAYIYTYMGRVYFCRSDIDIVYERFAECLSPDPSIEGTVVYTTEDGAQRRIRKATLSKALDQLKKVLERAAITRLDLSLEVPIERGLIKIANLHYTFRIDDEELLRLTLFNAYSIRAFIDTL